MKFDPTYCRQPTISQTIVIILLLVSLLYLRNDNLMNRWQTVISRTLFYYLRTISGKFSKITRLMRFFSYEFMISRGRSLDRIYPTYLDMYTWSLAYAARLHKLYVNFIHGNHAPRNSMALAAFRRFCKLKEIARYEVHETLFLMMLSTTAQNSILRFRGCTRRMKFQRDILIPGTHK